MLQDKGTQQIVPHSNDLLTTWAHN